VDADTQQQEMHLHIRCTSAIVAAMCFPCVGNAAKPGFMSTITDRRNGDIWIFGNINEVRCTQRSGLWAGHLSSFHGGAFGSVAARAREAVRRGARWIVDVTYGLYGASPTAA